MAYRAVRHPLGFLDGFLVAMGLISMDAFTMKSGSGSSFLVTSVSSIPDSETWSLIPFGRGPYGLYSRGCHVWQLGPFFVSANLAMCFLMIEIEPSHGRSAAAGAGALSRLSVAGALGSPTGDGLT